MSGSDLHTTGCNQPENTEILTIDDLPEEVLLKVFSYLLLPDRKHVRLVNKQWNELCNSARLTRRETFRFDDISDLVDANISKTVINLLFDNVDITHATLKLNFWKEHGRRVMSLKISDSSITEPVLCDIINNCPNIEHLSLFSVDFLPDRTTYVESAGNNLESLVELDVKFISNDYTLDLLTRNVPKLKHFSFWINDRDVEDKTILSLLRRQSHTVETLSFYGHSFVNDRFLHSLIELIGVQLTGLFIPKCSYLTDSLFSIIEKKFVNLERLELRCNDGFGFSINPSVLSNLKKLKLVSLCSTSIIDQTLYVVAALEQIEGLDLSCCESLTAGGIAKAFGTKHEKILDIRLREVGWITDKVLAQILPQLPNLRSIDLSYSDEITSVGVSTITTNCKLLRFLSLEACSKINGLSVSDMNGIKGLLYLNLSECPFDVDTVAELKYLELQIIILVNVPLTDEGLTSLLVNCPSLQAIQLTRYSETNLDLARIEQNLARETGRKCPAFRTGQDSLSMGSIFELSASHFNFNLQINPLPLNFFG